MIDIRYIRTDDKFIYTSKITKVPLDTKRHIRRLEAACIEGILDYGKAKNYIDRPDYLLFEFDLSVVDDMQFEEANWVVDSMICYFTELAEKTKDMQIINETEKREAK